MDKLKLIHIMLKVFKALIVAGAAFVIIFFQFLPKGEPIQLGSPLWLIKSPEISQKISEALPKVDQVNFLDFKTDVEIPLTNGLGLLISFFILTVSGYFFYLLHQAQLVVKDVRSGNPFSELNIRRIKTIGILVALSMFGEKILIHIGDYWFGRNYQFEGLKVASEPHLGWYIVIIGAIIFALGAAFEQGLKLQEDQDLTF
ncbi:MAG: DUF2975 domain-containing protein [Bacteroidota bacterium]